MPEILDIFNDQAFSAVSLTDTVNVVPNMYGRLNELGLFTNEPVSTTSVAIDIANGVLNLLPTRPRGGPASVGTREKQKLKAFVVPHIPHDDSVLALDVQNMLARAPRIGLETVIGAVNRKLITMRRKHAITLENLRVGAIKGRILDYDGSVIIDLFQEFGVTEQAYDFAFGNTAASGASAITDVGSVLRLIKGFMEDNLQGDTMTGVMGLASPSWFAKYVSHPSVRDAYKFFSSVQNPLRDDVRRGFTFQGVTIEEYRGNATFVNPDGTTTTVTRFIPDGDVRFFPLGTTETFVNWWAPPDFVDEVNTAPGLDAQVFVAPLERMKFGKGMDIHTESNPLPLCKRPNLLVRGFSSN